jgi:hypothetical protein
MGRNHEERCAGAVTGLLVVTVPVLADAAALDGAGPGATIDLNGCSN